MWLTIAFIWIMRLMSGRQKQRKKAIVYGTPSKWNNIYQMKKRAEKLDKSISFCCFQAL
jgi:hypothetical protein